MLSMSLQLIPLMTFPFRRKRERVVVSLESERRKEVRKSVVLW